MCLFQFALLEFYANSVYGKKKINNIKKMRIYALIFCLLIFIVYCIFIINTMHGAFWYNHIIWGITIFIIAFIYIIFEDDD